MEEILEGVLEGLQGGLFTLNFATSGLGVLVYILQALALYTLAQRREIKKPWMAWVPILNVWILGSLSDQYQYVVKRQVKNKRKVLLGLNIAVTAIAILLLVLVVVGIFAGIMSMEPVWEQGTAPIDSDVIRNMVGGALVVLVLTIPLAVIGVIYTVYFYMALYDIFCSCEPNNSTLYLVLSLVGNVVVSGAYALFLMLCKDKDLGMPPRKDKPEPEVVVEPAPGYDPWSDAPKATSRTTPIDPWEND